MKKLNRYKNVEMDRCPICRTRFKDDDCELGVMGMGHQGVAGPEYNYCFCRKCDKSWKVGRLKRGGAFNEIEEVKDEE